MLVNSQLATLEYWIIEGGGGSCLGVGKIYRPFVFRRATFILVFIPSQQKRRKRNGYRIDFRRNSTC